MVEFRAIRAMLILAVASCAIILILSALFTSHGHQLIDLGLGHP